MLFAARNAPTGEAAKGLQLSARAGPTSSSVDTGSVQSGSSSCDTERSNSNGAIASTRPAAQRMLFLLTSVCITKICLLHYVGGRAASCNPSRGSTSTLPGKLNTRAQHAVIDNEHWQDAVLRDLERRQGSEHITCINWHKHTVFTVGGHLSVGMLSIQILAILHALHVIRFFKARLA